MKKNIIIASVFGILLLSACVAQKPSVATIETAMAKTAMVEVSTSSDSEIHITDALIQTAIAKTSTAESIPTIEPSVVPTAIFQNTEVNTTDESYDGYLGEYIFDNNISIKVISVNFPVDLSYPEPQEGYGLGTIEVEFINTGDALGRMRDIELMMIDSDGFQYEVESINSISGVIFIPNERFNNIYRFSIPLVSKPSLLEYKPMDSGEIKYRINITPSSGNYQKSTLEITPNVAPPIGEYFETDGYKAVVLNINDPYITESTVFTPGAGKKWVSVEIAFENVNSQKKLNLNDDCGSFFCLGHLYLIDTEGFLFPNSFDSSFFDMEDSLNLEIGQKTRGWWLFKINENSTPSYIRVGEKIIIGLK